MSTFTVLGLTPTICSTLERLGYQTPTDIQARAIPLALAGGDIVARAETGTGKTAAFGLPIVQRLTASRPGAGRRPRALVLVPTRELAEQVARALMDFSSGGPLRITAIYGGASMGLQMRALRRGLDVVVATPGRLIDHLERGTIDLGAIEELTLDEADRMLDMGFLPALKRIVSALPASRRTLLFSATLPDAVLRLSATFTREATRVDVTAGRVVAASVTHQVHPVPVEHKRALLTHLLSSQDADQALVFCKTKRGSDRVGQHLERAGLAVAVIHGDKSQGQRQRALGAFKSGRLQVLVATDVAARGLDIAHLPLVVNYDLPLVPEDYVHRVGRTGRAGREGRAVSLVSAGERTLLRGIQRLLPAPLHTSHVDGFAPPADVAPRDGVRDGERRPQLVAIGPKGGRGLARGRHQAPHHPSRGPRRPRPQFA
ncbi:MAG: DEAD/DEAH box helicase [Vicinamibacterales bacterium]